MNLLHNSILVLLIFAANHAYSSLADQQTDTIGEILKSYSEAYASSPKEEFASAILKKEVKRDDRAKDFAINKQKKRDVDVPTETNSESQDSEYNSIPKEFNNYSHSSEEDTDKSEDYNEPPDHVIPFSEHENPKEPATRPNYTAPGEWAKPSANKNISLDFVPRKLYAQVRGTHTVKRLPREEAVKSAETNEEKENAARLKEVVKISKSNTVYTEEGYEDAAYDHAGQIKDANFHEGYAEKLKENLDTKNIDPDGERSKQVKKIFKSHKSRPKHINDFSDNSDVTESIQETRLLPLRDSKVLESVTNKPVINPKLFVQDSILQLEQDLKRVSYENQVVTTESHTSKPSYVQPVTESVYQNKIEYETTLKPVVYTVKPRTPTSILSKSYSLPMKIPPAYYSQTKDNVNRRNYVSDSYKDKPTITGNENVFHGHYLNKENETPKLTYSSEYFEPQTVTPLMANPLAVATVNGHGPYLLVGTESPNIFTPSSLENEAFGTTINYVTVSPHNVSIQASINRYINNPFLTTNSHKLKRIDKNPSTEYTKLAENRYKSRRAHKEKKTSAKSIDPPTNKSSSNHAKVMEYLQNQKNNNVDPYREIHKPSKSFYAVVTYPDNLRTPYSNAQEHWSVTHESERPVESVYNMTHNIQRPRIEATVQESAIPVTKLLPPAPLSASEYRSFYIQETTSAPMPPVIMSFVPFIAAIHRHKIEKKTIPYFFRKKRSLGPSREMEVMQRDQRLKKLALTKSSDVTEKRVDTRNKKSKLENFDEHIDEASKVVSEEINKEIKKRFKAKPKNESNKESDEDLNNESNEASNNESNEASNNESNEASNNESNEASNNESNEASNTNARKIVENNENSNDDDPVKVGVPELDFGRVFEEDEVEPTTKKPSVDINKYPFYKNDKISKHNALKYIVNPIEVPKKTFGGMEFYDSRNLECEEIDPNLEKIVPMEDELANKRGPRSGKPKLNGLGNKVDCFKAKYFDENPFDNPLFFEEIIELPPPPSELDHKQFASRILELSPENEEYIIPRGPKSPEDYSFMKSQVILKRAPNNYISQLTNNYHYSPHSEKSNFIPKKEARYRVPFDLIIHDKNRKILNKNRPRLNLKKPKTQVSPEYQRHVYEDVMGTIMNMENMYESHIPTQKFIPFNPNPVTHEYINEQEYGEFDKPKKQREATIDGLIPPPQYIFKTVPLKNNKFVHPNWRNVRIFKRSVEIENIKEFNNTSNHSDNNISKTNTKNITQIITTTPIPERPKRKRKTITILSDESTTPRIIYKLNDRIKSFNSTEEELGKYDKFTDRLNRSLSFDSRRNEPRYHILNRMNVIKNDINLTTSKPPDSEFSTTSSQSTTDPSLSRSTLIPVIVKPDANFTLRIPQESKTRYTKQKLENIDNDDQQVQLNEHIDTIDDNQEEERNIKNANNQYLVHENIQEEDDTAKSDEVETDFTVEPEAHDHKELVEFLKGDPPGYTDTFPKHETTPEYEEIKSNESSKNEELKVTNSKEEDEEEPEVERTDEDENSKEAYTTENTSDDSEDDSKENLKSNKEEEPLSTTSRESDNEPFVRYSSRPYSPPENYEDEQYSELGPRINKPYFYHPPFEVPEYEKHVLGKTVERAHDDDWNHNEETEDHETYVFPWEKDKDEDEEKDDESQHFSILSRYEYPWERRERKEKERRKREKLQKRNRKRYRNREDQYEDEEATNARPIFVPLKKKYSRNKKDVNSVSAGSKYRPIVKFSNKYKSKIIKDPMDDENMLTTITNTDEIMNYFQNSSSPKIKSSQISKKSIINDKYSLTTTGNVPNKKSNFIKTENTTSNLPIKLISSESVRINKVITEPFVSKSSASKHPTRIRSRRNRFKDNNSSSEKTTLSDQKTNQQNLLVRNSKPLRRRRSKDFSSTTTTSTSTKSPIKVGNRIRNRTTNVTSAVQPVTAKPRNRRRKRPFKTQSNVDKNNNILKINQISTTTMPTIATSTGRTIEHRSRVSKEEIITKTFYPASEEDDDDDDDIEDNSSKQSKEKLASEEKPDEYFKIKRRSKPKNDSLDDHTMKKKTVEKVTITMEETPDHVYRTKEIDRDGVKGKFTSITENNNSTTPSKRSNDLQMKDAEMEEMKRRMKAFSSFDNINRDTEDLVDDPSEVDGAENYIVGNLLQKLPLPTTRRESKVNPKGDIHLSDQYSSEEYDDIEDNDDNSDDDNDNYNNSDNSNRNLNKKYTGNSSDDNSNDNSTEESNENEKDNSDYDDSKEESKTEKNNVDDPPVKIIKDPNSRLYFYVERR